MNIYESVNENIKEEKLKEGYTAREQFEAGLSRRSEEDKKRIKVVAETEHYLLSIAKGESIYLNVFTGKTDDRMLPEVYIDQDYRGKCEKAEINWGAFGDCTADETQAFVNYLQEAIEFCKQINGVDFSSQLENNGEE